MAGDRGADPGPANVTPGADDHAQHASPTVLCPQGHVNAWDYRFCERCGSPIGVVPWPSEESGTRQTAPARSFVPLVVLAATLLVVAVVVTAVGYAVTRPARNDREEPSSARGAATTGVPFAQAEAASCPDDPVLEAESIDLTSDGLAVSAAFMSACAGGDVESNSALEVTVADGRRDVAAGSFDFSADPLRIEPGVPARRTPWSFRPECIGERPTCCPAHRHWRPHGRAGPIVRPHEADRHGRPWSRPRPRHRLTAASTPLPGRCWWSYVTRTSPTCESVSPIAGCRR